MLGVFKVETKTKELLLIDFQVKMRENGRKKIFSDMKRTNKVQLIFLDAKVHMERYQLHLWTLLRGKQSAAYVFSV